VFESATHLALRVLPLVVHDAAVVTLGIVLVELEAAGQRPNGAVEALEIPAGIGVLFWDLGALGLCENRGVGARAEGQR
jgi:hypothetical protein